MKLLVNNWEWFYQKIAQYQHYDNDIVFGFSPWTPSNIFFPFIILKKKKKKLCKNDVDIVG